MLPWIETKMKAQGRGAFTLVELLVSVAVLAIIVLFVSRMVDSAATITTTGNKRMDSDSQARPVLDRMAADFAQMVKRTDVDCYVKSSLNAEPGNDVIAFFSTVDGYYPTPSFNSPISLVAYRINSDNTSAPYNKMERMGKGLLWNSALPSPASLRFGVGTISNTPDWSAAISSSVADSDYELIGPHVFRFEYFYVLKTGQISSSPGPNSFQDVSAITVSLATIDPKSRVLLTDNQITTLPGRLKDFDPSQPFADLATSWQSTLDGITDMPRPAIAGVRVYQRTFYLR